MFSVEVLIFRAISPQSPIKIKSSLKQNFSMQKKVTVCSNRHPRTVCWASFLEQLSCRCGGGLAGPSAQPALQGMSAKGSFPLEVTLPWASAAPPCAPPAALHPSLRVHQAPAVCPPWWGWGVPAVSLSLGWAGSAEEWHRSRVSVELSRARGP